MYGAILGDMIGAPYEFDMGGKTKDFPLFGEGSEFTDDSVMTVAVAEALMDSFGSSDDRTKTALVGSMQKWGRRYPYAGYGGMFSRWLAAANPKPYHSFGNGSAMRVAAAGWLYPTMEETRHMAALTAQVSHNHPEGIKGAEAVAAAIFLARTGSGKEKIREYIVNEFGYDLSRTCDEIRPGYRHDETCQKTVPEAITAFLEGTDFEDVIRTAVSLGGDCDTLTCISGSIAEAMYGVPEELKTQCRRRLPPELTAVLERFYRETARLGAFPAAQGAQSAGIRRKKIRVTDYAGEILEAIPGGVLLTTKAEKLNAMTIGWGTLGTNWGKPVFAVYVREGRFTRSQLDRNPEFTVNVPLGKADPKIVSLCGRKSGRDIDKIREAGLTPVEGETVSVPAIKEFPLTLECRVIYSQKQDLSVLGKEIRDPLYPQEIGSEAPGVNRDPHVTYFGEILNAYILED